MSIAITIGATADIETYTGLQAFLVEYLELDAETEGQLPTLIRLAEYRLDRLLTVPQRESTTTLVATGQEVALPTEVRQIRAIRRGDGVPLSQVSPNTLFSQYSESGSPQSFAIIDQAIWLAPVPETTESLSVLYLTKLPSLADNETNWLLDQNADAYVYAAIRECEAFVGNDERAAMFDGALRGVIEEINLQGARYRRAGPLRLRSPVVV